MVLLVCIYLHYILRFRQKISFIMFYKCRACLNSTSSMKFLTETQPEGKKLITMFTSVSNFEWITNEKIPSYLCNECEAALQISFEFKKKCLKSNEIMLKQLNELISEENGQLQTVTKQRDVQEIVYECIACSYSASTLQALISHVSQLHRDIEQNWCCYCNQVLNDLSEHRKSHKFLKMCMLCDTKVGECEHLEISYNAGKLLLHSTDEDCVNQGDETVDKNKENGYKKTVNKSQGKYCEKCNKKVRNFQMHVNKVHSKGMEEQQNYVCYACGKEMKSNASLKAHLRLHKGDTPHKCSFCGKPHKNKGQLIEHERTHTGEKPHICSVCGKGFAQSGALGTHMKIHTGRPEVCTICDKRFCRPSELKLHLRKHSGEKPFLCTECGKAFIQKSHLMEHVQTHSDLRPFKCIYCDKAFKQKSLLNTHLQIHAGYKPLQCKLCEYACLRPYRLQQHMKLHDSDVKKTKMYVCKVCQKGFSTQAMLNAHMTSSHHAIL